VSARTDEAKGLARTAWRLAHRSRRSSFDPTAQAIETLAQAIASLADEIDALWLVLDERTSRLV
jgi:hypothetical protein